MSRPSLKAPESFECTAVDYDRARLALVTCQSQLYARTIEAIPQGAKRILELGAGTGLLSAEVAQAFPDAELVLVDAAPAMLEQAARRLQGHAALSCEQLDYSLRLPDGHFDAVVSSLSIHHLTHDDKQRLFNRIFEQLAGGGVFANADQVLGPTPKQEAYYQQVWERQAREAGALEEDLQAAIQRQKLDISATLSDQLLWLAEAGFEAVDCLFKDYRFAVMVGRKP